jgi:hypothetical protein
MGIVRIDKPPRVRLEMRRYSTMTPLLGSFVGDPRFSVFAVLSLSFALYVACLAFGDHRLRSRKAPLRPRRRHTKTRTW